MEDDRTLLARWDEGDEEAGQALFARHFDAVFRSFAHRVTDDTDELVQRTFLGALSARARFRGDSSFRTFLFAIARRQLLKFFEQRHRGKRITFATVSLADLGASVETRIARSQLQARLLEHMRTLPVDQQMALELHYWEELPVKEIAEILDAPVGTIKRWMHEARRTLATKLAIEERALRLGARPSQPR